MGVLLLLLYINYYKNLCFEPESLVTFVALTSNVVPVHPIKSCAWISTPLSYVGCLKK
jgi:hypothetical protein